MKTLIIAVMAFIFLTACNDGGSGTSFDEMDGPGVFRGRLHQDKEKTTPKGAKIYSGHTISDQWPAKADAGLDKLFRIARNTIADYPAADRHSSYAIWLYPRSPLCTNAAFLVSGDGSAWDGTDYDKDPRPGKVVLCAVGMMIRQGSSGGGPGMLVVDDLDVAETIVRFEGEHNELLDYWRVRYQETADVHNHPIMPDETGNFAPERAVKYERARLFGHDAAITK